MIKSLSEITVNCGENFDVKATAHHLLTINESKLEVKSPLTETSKNVLEFTEVIKKVECTNEQCWILLRDDLSLFNYDFVCSELTKISLNEPVQDFSCINNALLCVSKNNHLVKVTADEQKTIYEFPKHQKIKKIVCGTEHCVLLTSNGDVFSFGCGLRGCLGHDDVNSHDTPKQIEALAGLKIVDIAAGSFHSVAVTSFGDVFVWGWNTNGQLGLPKVPQNTFKKPSQSSQQVFTTPRLIELEDDFEAIKNVHCGAKHTILETEKNRLFAAGLNNYGQLGLSSRADEVDTFTEIPLKDVNDKTRIVCGYWSTFLIDYISQD